MRANLRSADTLFRGEVWWADLAEPSGSEPGSRRPVVIVQDDLLTQSRMGTVMVAPITSIRFEPRPPATCS